MTITIHSQNFKATDQLEEYATRKLERLYRYLPTISAIDLDLERQHTRSGETLNRAQITVRHARGAILRAEEKLRGETHETLEAAINLAVDKLYRQIERFKGKRTNHRARTRYIATAEELAAAEDMPPDAQTTQIDPDAEEPAVVRRKSVAMMPMSEQEAIDQMELLGHTFFVFFNPDTNSVNVLYKRARGDYGVLIPQMM
ncbi:MAG: ribosome-associated translation inhibitor RaiA [Armatimonadetes bacterium]|nr:ribosome-associated translation inhibitor RaiA [Anaerolineae bacterium]